MIPKAAITFIANNATFEPESRQDDNGLEDPVMVMVMVCVGS
jgi:hypothetical protein